MTQPWTTVVYMTIVSAISWMEDFVTEISLCRAVLIRSIRKYGQRQHDVWVKRVVLSHWATSSGMGRGRVKSTSLVCCWARKAAVQVACLCCPHPTVLHAAAPTIGEPSNAPHCSSHQSSHCRHLPARSTKAGQLPWCIPGLAACQPPGCPPPPWASAGCRQKKAGRQASKQTTEWGCSALLFWAAEVVCEQLASEGVTPPSLGNRQEPLRVGMPGYSPPSGPLLQRTAPTLKPGLIPHHCVNDSVTPDVNHLDWPP